MGWSANVAQAEPKRQEGDFAEACQRLAVLGLGEQGYSLQHRGSPGHSHDVKGCEIKAPVQ